MNEAEMSAPQTVNATPSRQTSMGHPKNRSAIENTNTAGPTEAILKRVRSRWISSGRYNSFAMEEFYTQAVRGHPHSC
jgi:hypothetical protein